MGISPDTHCRARARVLVVSSFAHRFAQIRLEHANEKRRSLAPDRGIGATGEPLHLPSR